MGGGRKNNCGSGTGSACRCYGGRLARRLPSEVGYGDGSQEKDGGEGGCQEVDAPIAAPERGRRAARSRCRSFGHVARTSMSDPRVRRRNDTLRDTLAQGGWRGNFWQRAQQFGLSLVGRRGSSALRARHKVGREGFLLSRRQLGPTR